MRAGPNRDSDLGVELARLQTACGRMHFMQGIEGGSLSEIGSSSRERAPEVSSINVSSGLANACARTGGATRGISQRFAALRKRVPETKHTKK
jgi:hypothetical protein